VLGLILGKQKRFQITVLIKSIMTYSQLTNLPVLISLKNVSN